MAIPHVVALYQWLRSKPDMNFPMLNDGAFAPEVIDEASMQSTTNKDIFIKRVARLKKFNQNPDADALKLAWFDNSDDYDGLNDFIGFIHHNQYCHQTILTPLTLHQRLCALI